ncbi:hypothetical protein GYMLUDRAFT_78352 [Collybiopsis luxurians FD-317 M1]|uniref:Uncharacterized protein n=1 Tax=Collybiopsis luxurians FD-317 M1 TaxID=944289 RepID=A0A0D0ALL3_9AGAR|nr:hypothetical protein GYMLUDRAFT_78352 [Collybiopsis luxurians FD-317 M1]
MSTTALGTLSTDFTVTILRARSSLDLTGALIALLSHLPNLHSRTWRMSGDSQHVYPHPTPARSKKHPNIFPIPRLPHSIRSPEPTVSTKTLNPFDHPFPSNVDPDKPLTTFNSFNDAFSSIDHIRSTGDSFTLDSDYGIAREKASSLG